MPNHCENKLTIQANSEEEVGLVRHYLGSLRTPNQDNNLNFMRLLPRPDDQEENWYEWNIQNWGTKWNCYDVVVSDIECPEYTLDQSVLTYNFQTAWSPMSDNLVLILSKEFPNVHITLYYSEPGMMFGGCTTAFGAGITNKDTWELNPCYEHYLYEGQDLLFQAKKEASE